MHEVKATDYLGNRIIFLAFDLNVGSSARIVSKTQWHGAWPESGWKRQSERAIPQLVGADINYWGFGNTLQHADKATWEEVEMFLTDYPTLRGCVCHNGKIKCCF